MKQDWRELFRDLERDGRLKVFDPRKPVRPDFVVGSKEVAIPGSDAARCADCATTIYLSDSRSILKLFPDVPVVCMACASRRIDAQNQPVKRAGYWMQEESGILRPVVEKYLDNQPLTPSDILIMQAYLRQWIEADGWGCAETVAELRRSVSTAPPCRLRRFRCAAVSHDP